MTTFVTKYTNLVKQIQNQNGITGVFDKTKEAEKNADTQ